MEPVNPTDIDVLSELEAIKVYCHAIARENNRAIIKLLVREEISERTAKLIDWFKAIAGQSY